MPGTATSSAAPLTGLREACGVIGIYAPGADVARLAYFGLFALQHRGQESAGIATSDGDQLYVHTRMGLVAQAFDESALAGLKGHGAIGHTRYSTTGSSRVENAQPLLVRGNLGQLAVGHNGNLVNAPSLREELARRGITPTSTTDSEVLGLICANAPGTDWLARLRATLPRLSGAFCLVLLTPDALFAVRDPLGIRPLCLGRLPDGGWVVASESCALDTIGAAFIREVEPGELLRIDAGGVRTERFATSEAALASGRPVGIQPLPMMPTPRRAACSFEHIYFARPDSVIDGQLVYLARERMGRVLAREQLADADIVIAVPDASVPAAIGYATELGIPFREGFVKNRYIGRTFIQPVQDQRSGDVALKLNPLPEVLKGKRVVVVDDSIVRGTTTPRVVAQLRRAGAKEVHMRISSPPMAWPCYLGVDTAPIDSLIAARMSVPEIRAHIGADSLGYLSLEGLVEAIGLPESTLCNACFHGRYPMPIEVGQDKFALEPT
ncbi:MAG: amidophosphoribosyltransferase [Chloroflexota bacterium]|nr:amidophosphoribosyltransferase [Chloroflexota bacterium]